MSEHPQLLPPHYKWNFTAFLVDYVCFGIAFTLVSLTSVLPAFVRQLTASAPVIGLVSTIFNGGWLLPQLAAARLINDKPRKKPFLVAMQGGRIVFWVIALALLFGLARYPAAMLLLFFACLGLWATTDGIASVAWFDIVARAIPLKRRGRLIGTGQIISGLVGVGVGALVGSILERCSFPGNYALIFALAGIAITPSTVAITLLREPPPEKAVAQTAERVKSSLLAPLAADRIFRRLVACRLLIGMLGLSSPFYVVHAADVLHLPQSIIGVFVIAQMLAGVAASAVLGPLSERRGPRYVIYIGSAIAATGPLFALVTHLVGGGQLARAYPFVYVTLGVINNVGMLGFFNYLLEIAPRGMRPTYIGLSNTILGILTLAPIAGGWLLEATSYSVLFGVTAVLATAGFLLSLGLSPPPFHHANRRAVVSKQPAGSRVWLRVAFVAALTLATGAALWIWREPLWAVFGDQARVREWIAGFGPWAPLVSIALNAAQVLLAPLPGQFVGIANGYLYGLWLGTLYSMVGLVVGTTLAMALGRWFGRPLVERLAGAEKLARWDRIANRRGPLFFFLVFLFPFLPDDVVCFLIGLSPLSIPRMVVLASLGRLPGVFVSCWVGAHAAELPWWAWLPLGGGAAALAWLFWRYQGWLEALALRVIHRLTTREMASPGRPDDQR